MKNKKSSGNVKEFIRQEIVNYHEEQKGIEKYTKLLERLFVSDILPEDYWTIERFFTDPMQHWFPELKEVLHNIALTRDFIKSLGK